MTKGCILAKSPFLSLGSIHVLFLYWWRRRSRVEKNDWSWSLNYFLLFIANKKFLVLKIVFHQQI